MEGSQTIAKFTFRTGLFFLLGQILLIALTWRSLPPKLPLFYSRPWGEEQLAIPLDLFILPLFSLAILIINSLLTKFILQENLLKQTLMLTVAVVNLLNLITLIQIIRLVI